MEQREKHGQQEFSAVRLFLKMAESNNFYNQGFGWICRRCEADGKKQSSPETHSRLLREGEAESKTPRFSTAALAKWADRSRTTLVCPRCGISEPVNQESQI